MFWFLIWIQLSLCVSICLYLSLFAFSKFFDIMNMLLQVPGSNPSGSNPALLLVIYIYYIISYQNHIPILPPHKLQRLAPIFPGLFHVARDQFVVCEVQG